MPQFARQVRLPECNGCCNHVQSLRLHRTVSAIIADYRRGERSERSKGNRVHGLITDAASAAKAADL